MREVAFRALFQFDALGDGGDEAVDAVRVSVEEAVEDARGDGEGGSAWLAKATGAEVERGVTRAAAVFARRRSADAELNALSPGWPAPRRPAVDRALLRLGWYELRETATPAGAVINEMVELAKRYSTERSPAFVNAVLDAVRKRVEAEAVAAGAEGGGEAEG